MVFYFLREEAFGPVAPLLRFKTEEEAIRIANDTDAGSISRVRLSDGIILKCPTWLIYELGDYLSRFKYF